MTKETKKETSILVLKGKVTYSAFGATKLDKRELYRLSVEMDTDSAKKLREHCKTEKTFEEVKDGYVPNWYMDEKENVINLKSQFTIPTEIIDRNTPFRFDFDEINKDAEILVAVVVKSGAVYPHSIRVLENGVAFNPFEGM